MVQDLPPPKRRAGLKYDYAKGAEMTENLHDTTRNELATGHDWLNETLLIELDLSPEFSWGRLAETRMCQFESAMADEVVPDYSDEENKINSSVMSFYMVNEVYISSSDES
jgi:hypothetical protein